MAELETLVSKLADSDPQILKLIRLIVEERLQLRGKIKELEEWKSTILETLNANGYGDLIAFKDRGSKEAVVSYIQWVFEELNLMRFDRSIK